MMRISIPRVTKPHVGDHRVFLVFLIFPVKLRNDDTELMEWRWLEWARITQEAYVHPLDRCRDCTNMLKNGRFPMTCPGCEIDWRDVKWTSRLYKAETVKGFLK